MKPFDQWVDEIAEREAFKPDGVDFFPEDLQDGAEECEYCGGTGASGQTYSDPCGDQCGACEGTGRVDHVKCRGCDRYGAPNCDGGQYCCGGSPYCCP